MKVSVIVPVYNVEDYIEKCLISIKNQTLKDFECLVINDATVDNSIKVARKAVKGDKRFKFFNKENGGLSDTRNFGIKKAKGEYIAFIDSDDYIDKDLLKLAYNAGKKHNSDLVCFDMYYDKGYDNLEYSYGANYKGVSSYKENKEIVFSNNSANNKLYKTSFLKDKMFIKGMWYEDMAVIPIWVAEANNMVHINKPLYYYVQREGSITHKADNKIFDIYLALNRVKNKLQLSSYEIKNLYFENCIVMTTLRIKDIDNKDTRIDYYKKNLELLNLDYPNWYCDLIKENEYNIKQKIVFTLLKLKMFSVLDMVYNR